MNSPDDLAASNSLDWPAPVPSDLPGSAQWPPPHPDPDATAQRDPQEPDQDQFNDGDGRDDDIRAPASDKAESDAAKSDVAESDVAEAGAAESVAAATDMTGAVPSESTAVGPTEITDPQIVEPELRRTKLPRFGIFVVMVVVTVARFAFASDRTIYQLAPDEPGSLAMARWLSGGVRFTMFDYNTWRPGLAILLAPVNAFTDDPQYLMWAAFAINAVLAAISTILLARLAVRLTSLPAWACLFAAATISLAAPSLSASAHVWAESLVTLSTLWLITSLISFFDQPRLGPAISASTAVAVGVVSHGRLLPTVPVLAVLVVFGFITSHRAKRLWAWGAYTAVVCAGAIEFTNYVFSRVWDKPGGTNTIGTVVNHAADVPAVAQSAVGQLWYQLVATFGVFGVGLAVLIWHAIGQRSALPLARDARIILFVTLPLIFTSVAFMSGRDRTDHRIYGRYNDAIVWPILIVGIGWLASRVPWTRRVAMLAGITATTIGTGALVYALDGDAMAKSVGVRPMIPGFLPLTGASPDLDPWRLTAFGVVGAIVVFWLLAIRRLTPLTVTAVVVGLVLGGIRTHDALATRLNSWAAAGDVVAIDESIAPDAPLAFRFVPDKEKPAASWVEQRRRALLYQVYLPHHPFEPDKGIDDGGSPYVFAPLDDPEMTNEGATLVWTDTTVKIGLWVEPGADYTSP